MTAQIVADRKSFAMMHSRSGFAATAAVKINLTGDK